MIIHGKTIVDYGVTVVGVGSAYRDRCNYKLYYSVRA